MLDKLISTTNANVKSSHTHENSSIQKDKNEKYAQSKKKSNFHFSFNCHPTLNYLILIFTFFSIILPIGTQPILQTNLAFAQSDLSSRSSDSKLQINSNDPFDFSRNNVKKASENIIIPILLAQIMNRILVQILLQAQNLNLNLSQVLNQHIHPIMIII